MPDIPVVRVVPLLRRVADATAKKTYRKTPDWLRECIIKDVEQHIIPTGRKPHIWRGTLKAHISTFPVNDALFTRAEQRRLELNLTWSEYIRLLIEINTGVMTSATMGRHTKSMILSEVEKKKPTSVVIEPTKLVMSIEMMEKMASKMIGKRLNRKNIDSVMLEIGFETPPPIIIGMVTKTHDSDWALVYYNNYRLGIYLNDDNVVTGYSVK